MPWFRIDDGLPQHSKSLALWKACAKKWDVYAVAVWLWRDVGCDCAHKTSMGRFERERAYHLVRAPEKVVDKALESLVAAGFMEPVGQDEFQFHDWTDYNPTKEEIEAKKADISAKRAVAGSKGGNTTKDRRLQQTGSKATANGQQSYSKPPATVEQPASNGAAPIPLSRTSEQPPTPSQQPEVVVEAKAPPLPPLDPDSTNPEDIMRALHESSLGRVDPWTGRGTDVEIQMFRRFADVRFTVRRALKFGELARNPRRLLPDATTLRAEDSIRMSLLMGAPDANGVRPGTWFSVALAKVDAAMAEDERVATKRATETAMTTKTPATGATARSIANQFGLLRVVAPPAPEGGADVG